YKKLISGSRKRQFYYFGGEAPFQDGTKVTYIGKSLEEGVDTDYLDVLYNIQRSGSYSRGFQTRLGGEKTKTIYRMLGTVKVEMDDCGSKVGIPVYINPKTPNKYV